MSKSDLVVCHKISYIAFFDKICFHKLLAIYKIVTKCQNIDQR